MIYFGFLKNSRLKCDDFEWEVFSFAQKVLRLIGIDTEEIRFKRRQLVNDAEVVQSIQQCASDLDLRTRLKLNPMIEQDEIDGIIEALDAEAVFGLPSVEELQKQMDEMRQQEQQQQQPENNINLNGYSDETQAAIKALLGK